MKPPYLNPYIVARIAIVTLVLLLCSCNTEPYEKEPKSNDKEVYINILTPRSSFLDDSGNEVLLEEHISTVELLLFKDDKLFDNPIYAQNIASDPDNANRKTLSVKLPIENYDIVILANSRIPLSKIVGSLQIGQDTKEDVLSRLIVDLPTGGWSSYVADPDHLNLMPMWGEKKNVTIDQITTLGNIYLHRMLARVDFSLNINNESIQDFKITQIKLYNSQNKGRIAPLESNWNNIGNCASLPSVVGERLATPIDYSQHISSDGKKLDEHIYMFESPKAQGHGDANAPCILIQGEYKDVLGWYRLDFSNHASEESQHVYYDILRNNHYNIVVGKVTGHGYLNEKDALENKGANISVSVYNWEEYDLGNVVFDDQHMLSINPSDIVLDKLERSDNKIVVKTDLYSKQPLLQVSTDPLNPGAGTPDWLTNVKLESLGEINNLKVYDLTFDVSENNETKARNAYIFITVNKLTNIARITQETNINVKLDIFKKDGDEWIETASMRFPQTKSNEELESRIYKICWTPATSKVDLALIQANAHNDRIAWEDGFSPLQGVVDGTIENPEGEMIFEIKPQPIENYLPGSFVERQCLLTANITYSGRSELTTLMMRQFVEDVYVEGGTAVLDGLPNHFVTVKANVPWELEVTKNISTGDTGIGGTKVVEDWPVLDGTSSTPIFVNTGNYNLPEGTPIYFTTVNDLAEAKIRTGKIGFKVKTTDKDYSHEFEDEFLCASGVSQKEMEANCYVLDPKSGLGLLIPVRAANGKMIDKYSKNENNALFTPNVKLYDQPPLGENTKFGVKLVWSDVAGSNNKGLASDALISQVLPAGVGEDGYILVLGGDPNKNGNAVVAITENEDGTGDILWSWHIWVTDAFSFDGSAMNGRIVGGEGKHKVGEEVDYNNNRTSNAGNWLDRNLGAISNTPNSVGTLGNYYQWGRKDPFPGSKSTTLGIKRDLYDANGPLTYPSNVAQATTIQNSIKTPLTFYSLDKNWVAGAEADDIALWGVYGRQFTPTVDKGKSIFDPCPAGWRIPSKKDIPWQTATDYWGEERISILNTILNENWWNDAEMGLVWGRGNPDNIYKGGYYPAAGDRRSGSADFANVGKYGQYWSAYQKGSTSSYYFQFRSDLITPSSEHDRWYAYPIRCVRE